MKSANGWISKVRWWWLTFGVVLFAGSMIVLFLQLNPFVGAIWFLMSGAAISWALWDLIDERADESGIVSQREIPIVRTPKDHTLH